MDVPVVLVLDEPELVVVPELEPAVVVRPISVDELDPEVVVELEVFGEEFVEVEELETGNDPVLDEVVVLEEDIERLLVVLD